MRSAVLLLSLSVLPIAASADTLYDITFMFPGISGYGAITTDGTCIDCNLGAGLLGFSFTLADVPFFRLTFDNPAAPFSQLSFDTSSRQLAGVVYDSAGDSLGFFFQPESPPFRYFELSVGQPPDVGIFDGSYTVVPATAEVPETTSVVLLASVLAMLGFLSRRTHAQ